MNLEVDAKDERSVIFKEMVGGRERVTTLMRSRDCEGVEVINIVSHRVI